MPLTRGTTLDAYAIVECIGLGGMGEVYLATDGRLGRRVALKVLPGKLAADGDRLRRFEQEARAASSLNHPNIVTIYDIGVEGGLHYIAMEHVDGVTLRDIASEGSVPPERLLDLAEQIVRGLAKAHEAGIVHRDLKPENLMLSRDGYVKILDFGLAKLTPKAERLPSERVTVARAVTEAGLILGTVSYMSPEQARGAEIDHRSDQFSLGSILYELASGRQAFARETAAQTLAAILEVEPLSLLELEPAVPAHFVEIVERCLKKRPGDRFASTSEIADALRAPASVPGVMPSTRSRTTLGTAVTKRAVAVMPLSLMGPSSGKDYFADAMTEALTVDLAKIGAIKVISTTSAMRYRGTSKSHREIAEELAVDAVVEGSVLRADDQVRIAARLIDTETGEHLWAESYDREFKDVLNLQRDVARAIARSVEITLSPREDELLAKVRSVDPVAHDAYLKGRYYLNKSSPESWRQALHHFRRAVESDPEHAAAHAGLADTYGVLGLYGLDTPGEALARAKEAALRAIALDDTLAEAHASLAAAMLVERDSRAVESEFRRAFELNPGTAGARAQYAIFCRSTERPEQGLSEMKHALELDPLSPLVNTMWAYLLYSVRRYEEAIEQCHRTLDLDRGVFQVHAYLAMIYRRLDRLPEAAREWGELARSIGAPKVADAMERTFAVHGFEASLTKFARAASRGYYFFNALRYLRLPRLHLERVSPILIAMLYAEASENERAIAWLEKSCAIREPQTAGLSFNPHWDELRTDRRFEAMVERTKLPPVSA